MRLPPLQLPRPLLPLNWWELIHTCSMRCQMSSLFYYPVISLIHSSLWPDLSDNVRFNKSWQTFWITGRITGLGQYAYCFSLSLCSRSVAKKLKVRGEDHVPSSGSPAGAKMRERRTPPRMKQTRLRVSSTTLVQNYGILYMFCIGKSFCQSKGIQYVCISNILILNKRSCQKSKRFFRIC